MTWLTVCKKGITSRIFECQWSSEKQCNDAVTQMLVHAYDFSVSDA